MRLDELQQQSNADVQKLAALSEFLLSRADDKDSKKTIPQKTFIFLSQGQGVSLTSDRLKELSVQPPLSNFISDVQGDEKTGTIFFKGSEADSPVSDVMSVDKARATVDKMAKRAVNSRM